LMISNSLAFALQLGLLGVIEVLIFEDLVEFLAQVLILVQDLWHPLRIEKRYGRTVVHRLAEVVLRYVASKPFVRLPVASEQRRAGESEVLGIGEPSPHVLCERFVLSSVGFIYDDDDVVAIGQHGVLLTLRPTELLNQRKDEALILAQERAHLLTIPWLGCIGFPHGAGIEEVPVDLSIGRCQTN